MRVNPQDARCRECGEDLRIVDASDGGLLLTVERESCGDICDIGADFLNDGARRSLPAFLAGRAAEERKDA